MNKKTIAEEVNESSEEFVPHDILHFDELTEEAQEQALFYFVKYNLMYMDEMGITHDSEISDLDNEYTKKLIIKTCQDMMQFFEDGSIF